ncbi:MAG: filamentous hemagglutinin N-terminal domain-containing protein [Cyanobacteria bacterium SID2]|nr:filamentous hemagglutinin N-terminal domain-containing protein [Cyanobacteria bacterium SID2]
MPSQRFQDLLDLSISMLVRFGTTAVSIAAPVVLSASSSIAQISPDGTLPDNSRVNVDGDRFVLEGGTEAGGNLFHSFDRFNVPENTEAFFNNNPNIDRIITRVTGGDLSTIDGTISANGTASLFLINPNGIRFGENARLQIGGSFFATTAEHLLFADGTQFSASDPQAGTLLTINVPIGVQFGDTPGSIVNRSQAPSSFPSLDPQLPLPENAGLEVSPGQVLGLFGGNIAIDGGNLSAFQGQIHLGSVGGAGIVQFGQTPTGLTFDYRGVPQLGSIDLSNGAVVTASGLGGGSIELRGETIDLTGGASLRSDTFGDFDGRGIDIDARTFQLSDRAFVSSSTFGSGAGGNVNVNANIAQLTGTMPGEVLEQLLSNNLDLNNFSDGFYVLSIGSGTGGSVTLEVDRLTLQNGAAILTTAIGGQGGDITVRAMERIDVSSASLLVSGTSGVGNAGQIDLTTERFELLGGSLVGTSPNNTSTGNGGDLTVRADTLELRGTPAGFLVPGGLFTATLGTGAAGDLSIETRQLQIVDGMQVSAASSSAGPGGTINISAVESIELDGVSADNIWLSGVFTTSSLLEVLGQTGTAGAGNLQIETQRLTLRNGARISAATGGEGAAGSLTVNATESVDVSGSIVSGLGRFEPSALFSESRGSGNAGDLRVNTHRLTVRDGGEIAVRGRGTGAAGNLEINAAEVLLADRSAIGASNVNGLGGNILLNVDRLSLVDGAQIETNTLGSGRAGNVRIHATESVDVRGISPDDTNFSSSIAASASQLSEALQEELGLPAIPSGDSGNISIETQALTVDDRGFVNVRNDGLGNPGRIDIAADAISLLDRGGITAVSTSGSGGNISIDTRTMQLDTGLINASTVGDGTGGNISIRASESVEVVGSGFTDLLQTIFIPALFGRITLANAQQGIVAATDRVGTAGNISIETGRLVVREGGFLGTATLGSGNAGDLEIVASESIDISSSFVASTTSGSGAGGNVIVTSPRIRLSDGASFSTTTLSSGRAGNQIVRASESIELEGVSPTGDPATTFTAGSTIGTTGIGGSITVETPNLTIRDGARMSVASDGSGNAGNLEINGRVFRLEDGLLRANSLLGQGGNVELNFTDAVILRDGSQITTQAGTAATGGGDGGNITIATGSISLLEGSRINANAFEGAGGNIQIATQGLFVDRDSQITASSQFGIDGTVSIQTPDIDAENAILDLPEDPIDPDRQIARGCAAGEGNTFIVTGRGGLPENPTESLRDTASWGDVRDWRTLQEELTSESIPQSSSSVNSRSSGEERSLVEATTWVRLDDGSVRLVAQPGQHSVLANRDSEASDCPSQIR